MDARVGLLVLLVLAGNYFSEARDIAALQVLDVEEVDKLDVCPLCEEYVAMALSYLNDDKTQAEVMETLHHSCSQMHNLADKCTVMVDRYAGIFFTDVSLAQPDGFCKKVGLCRNPAVVSSLPEKRDKCEICHKAIEDVLEKLKDPDTELDIIERLLKACNSVGDKYKTKCKKLVFEYGPVILVDAGSFVEKFDICTTFHACDKHPPKTGMIEMVTSS